MARIMNLGANALAVALAGLAFYVGGWGLLDNIWLSTLTVGLGLSIALLSDTMNRTRWQAALHLAIAALFLWIMWGWTDLMLRQEQFFITISTLDDVLAWTGIAITGYLTWRYFGLPMALVMLACVWYALGPSGWLAVAEDWRRVAENMWFSTDGVFGAPVEVVSRIVLVFILFGAVLQTSGAGEVLMKFAFAATGRFAGGPAHAAVVGSAMFGTMSGAPIANVVSTGVFTIPVIKRSGFSPAFAGGVEAAASSGGQLMPPVMGVVAFLMADVTGIAYPLICVAAAIPALMYYGSLFVAVLLEARRLGIGAVPKAERPVLTRQDWLKGLAFVVPLAVLVIWLLDGRSPQNAGWAATIAAVVLSLAFFPDYRHPRMWLKTLVDAGRTMGTLMIVATSVGFVIGIVNMTGIGLQFAEAIQNASGSNLLVSLVFVMLGCLVMGMGVPTGAAYLVIAIVLGPALEGLGLPTIAVHLFVVYFAALSVVTPPVALAAFAAAPIAGAGPMETGFAASRLALAGFVIPYLFVYHQDILIIVDGFHPVRLLWSVSAFALATWCVASAIAGFDTRPLPLWERALRILAGIVVLIPHATYAAPAAALGVGLIAFHRLSSPDRRTTQRQTAEQGGSST